MSRQDELDRQLEGSRLGAWELAGWGAGAGLVTAAAVRLLMGYHGMLDTSGVGGIPAWGLFIGYGTVVGAAIGRLLGYRPGGRAAAASGGVLIGLLGWLLFPLTVDPLLHGQPPTWSAGTATAAYRELVADLPHGGLTGLLVHGVLALRAIGFRSAGTPAEAPRLSRIVIVGGGFAGVS